MSYTDVFGGGTINPSQRSYDLLTLAASITLQWPIEQQIGGNNVVADILDVDATIPALTITMPDARQVSTGMTSLFVGIGANTFTVLDNLTGNTILTVASGEAWFLYLTDNSTQDGVWAAFQLGMGTSSATAASLVGAGIKAITTTLNQKVDITATAITPTTLVDADRATALLWTGGVGILNLPNPATVGTDWFSFVKNAGSGVLTVTPPSGTIDGSATFDFAINDSAIIITDGVNFYTIGKGTTSSSFFDFISISIAGTGNYTLAGIELNRISYRLSGILTGNRNVIVPDAIQQYWVDNQTTGAFTVTVKTAAGSGILVQQGRSSILYSDGTNVVDAVSGSSAIPSVVQGDLLYGSAPNVVTALPKSAVATRYLSNQGVTNNPLWDLVNLANGVSGTLGIGNGGSGQVTANAAFNAFAPAQGAANTFFLQSNGANTLWKQLVGVGTDATPVVTGLTTAPTTTVSWIIVGDASVGQMVVVTVNQVNAVSNATTMTITGWPVAIRPPTIAVGGISVLLQDNSVLNNPGSATLNTAGTLSFLIGSPRSLTGFTNVLNKGFSQFAFAYYLI